MFSSRTFLPLCQISINFRRPSVDHPRDITLADVLAIQTFTDETGAPATLPEVGNGGEEGKIKVLLGLLKK